MKIRMFTSYSIEEREFIDELNRKIKSAIPEIEPLIVEYQKEGGKVLQKKVIDSLEDCKWFFVLLTNNSITNQWVNQEIGYAMALKMKGEIEEFIPVVERIIFDGKDQLVETKGFIHKQMESATFIRDHPEKSINNIINYLKSAFKRSKKSDIKKLEELAKTLERDGYLWETSQRLKDAARLHLEKKEVKAAIDKLSKSAEILKKGGWPWEAAEAMKEIADLYLQNKMLNESLDIIEKVGDLYMSNNYCWEAGTEYEKGGDLANKQKLYQKAKSLYEKASSAYEKKGYKFEAENCGKKINKLRDAGRF